MTERLRMSCRSVVHVRDGRPCWTVRGPLFRRLVSWCRGATGPDRSTARWTPCQGVLRGAAQRPVPRASRMTAAVRVLRPPSVPEGLRRAPVWVEGIAFAGETADEPPCRLEHDDAPRVEAQA